MKNNLKTHNFVSEDAWGHWKVLFFMTVLLKKKHMKIIGEVTNFPLKTKILN